LCGVAVLKPSVVGRHFHVDIAEYRKCLDCKRMLLEVV
jgi:hypothetical protein